MSTKRDSALSEIFDTLIWSALFMKRQVLESSIIAPHPQGASAPVVPESPLTNAESPKIIQRRYHGREGRYASAADEKAEEDGEPEPNNSHENNLIPTSCSLISPLTSPGNRFGNICRGLKIQSRNTNDGDDALEEGLLDTNYANAPLLQSPVLRQVFEELLNEIRPARICRTEFISLVNAVLDTGHYPPLNAILCSERNTDVETTSKEKRSMWQDVFPGDCTKIGRIRMSGSSVMK